MTDRNRPEEHQDRVVIRDKRKIDPVTGQPRQPDIDAVDLAAVAHRATSAGPARADVAQPRESSAEEDVPKAQALLLEERTRDLQRLQAEYANYRKRVERDRLSIGEQAVGGVLATLLPVLDDIDRARNHGDLVGAFKAVADQVDAVLSKLGLESFGDVGDPFDPAVHEAVMHAESAEVSEPTCTTVMRRGYRHGERLLRPAMVGVTDPAPADETRPPAAAPTEPAGPAGNETAAGGDAD